jgi:cell surface protein SprA
VRRDYVVHDPGQPLTRTPSLDNGWRRLRVSLANDSLVKIVKDLTAADPAWERIFHCRAWLEGFPQDSLRVQIGGIEITGNRWFENQISDLGDRPLPDSSLAPAEDFYVGVLNNKDDAAVYYPPFTPQRQTQDNSREREQSITLELANFQPGHRASIYRSFPQPQDYSSLYRGMQFYLNRRFEMGRADLVFAIRLSKDANSDTTNYYEYRLPVPDDWVLVDLDFAQLSQLQLQDPDNLTGLITKDLGGGVVITRKGRPSLTSIQRITLSVTNAGRVPLARGNVWVDELRLTSVKKDRGIATRFHVQGNFADFSSFDFGFERRDANFLAIGQDRGSGTTSTTWNFGSDFTLEKFVEGSGLRLPLRLRMSRSRQVPKFQTNSDLVVDKPTDRDITEHSDQEVSFSYAKQRSENALLRYLVDPFSLSGNYRRTVDLQPTKQDTSVVQTGNVGWSLPLEGIWRLKLTQRQDLQLLPTATPGATSPRPSRGTRDPTGRAPRSGSPRAPARSPPSTTRSTARGISISRGIRRLFSE